MAKHSIKSSTENISCLDATLARHGTSSSTAWASIMFAELEED
jgi:hypothetical protein